MSDPTALLSLHPVITAFVAATGIAAGVAKGFEWLDGALNDDSRLKLSLWLVSVPGDEQIDAWAKVFPNLIDQVFGPRPISWKFFFRSCIASTIAIIAVVTLTFLHYGYEPMRVQMGEAGTWYAVGIALIIISGENCLPGYIAILTSRYIVRMMSSSPTALRTSLLLILDTVLIITFTAIGLLILLYVSVSIVNFSLSMGALTAKNLPQDAVEGLTASSGKMLTGMVTDPYNRMFMLASLFSSVWVWLYVLSSLAIRILHKVRFVWVKIIPVLDIEKKPMQAIGRLAGVMAGCGYLALLGGMWIFTHL